MKKSLLGLFGMLGLVSVLAAPGCGGSSTVTAAEVTAACNAYCDAYIAKACADPFYTSADECKTAEECSVPADPSSCAAAAKTYYDCARAQADLCADDGCDSQFDAYDTICP